MRRADAVFIVALAAAVAPFVAPDVRSAYESLNAAHPLVLSFLKFALLATLGEVIALRLRAGRYDEPGFGLLPRAVVWGLLGICIYAAFGIFAAGTPALLRNLGLPVSAEVMAGPFSALKLVGAFAVSTAMNLVFAPVMMTVHRLSDEHIARTGGRLAGLLQCPDVGALLKSMDWTVMWGFVFKKTLPLFWIPAHTITFLLPQQHRVLFAALLGIALGVILAFARRRPVQANVPEPTSAAA